MDSICTHRQKALASLFHKKCLKADGFKKHHVTWNKTNESGFVYVVNFQNRFGNFADDCRMTVNLGVHLPILLEEWQEAKLGKYVKEYECNYRARLGVLTVGKDTWWTMRNELDELCLMLGDLYNRYALDWFTTYSSYESIIAWWQSLEENHQTAMGIGKTMACLFAKLGYEEEAKRLFEALIQRYQDERPRGMPNLVKTAMALGIKVSLNGD